MAKDRLSGKPAVILHADIAGSTALVQQDEQLAHERIQDVLQRFSRNIEKYHGLVHELRDYKFRPRILPDYNCYSTRFRPLFVGLSSYSSIYWHTP